MDRCLKREEEEEEEEKKEKAAAEEEGQGEEGREREREREREEKRAKIGERKQEKGEMKELHCGSRPGVSTKHYPEPRKTIHSEYNIIIGRSVNVLYRNDR